MTTAAERYQARLDAIDKETLATYGTCPVVPRPDSVTHWSCPKAPWPGMTHYIRGMASKCQYCHRGADELRTEQAEILAAHQKKNSEGRQQ